MYVYYVECKGLEGKRKSIFMHAITCRTAAAHINTINNRNVACLVRARSRTSFTLRWLLTRSHNESRMVGSRALLQSCVRFLSERLCPSLFLCSLQNTERSSSLKSSFVGHHRPDDGRRRHKKEREREKKNGTHAQRKHFPRPPSGHILE